MLKSPRTSVIVSWTKKIPKYIEEIGSFLLRQPELVHDMVKQARMRVPSNFPISIKIRLDWYPE